MNGYVAAAIVPAYNEERTIGAVIRTLAASGVFRDIIVISDGSTDGTERAAREAGATLVHQLPWKHGKGAAMGHGVAHTDADVVAFFDADLKGLTADHIRTALEPVTSGRMYMHMLLRDRGPFWTALSKRLPMVGGERAVRRVIFDLIPERYLGGFKVESALNYFCRVNGLPYGLTAVKGLSIVRKMEKVGFRKGLWQYVHMWAQVAWAMVQVRLARGEFVERGTHMRHKH